MASTSNSNNYTRVQRYRIAISQSGKEIAILDCDTFILRTWKVNENEVKQTKFICKLRNGIGINTKEENWSLAISDAADDGNTLIALSCFNFNKEGEISIIIEGINENIQDDHIILDTLSAGDLTPATNSSTDNLIGAAANEVIRTPAEEEAKEAAKILNSIQMNSTRVISTSNNKVSHEIGNFYGFLQFFKRDRDMLIISNHLGIVRGLCTDEADQSTKNFLYKRWIKKNERSSHKLSKFFHKILISRFNDIIIKYHEQSNICYNKNADKPYEIYRYPNDFIESLKVMNEEQKSNLIQNCVVCGKLFIHNEDNNIEMYNLFNRNMDMLYHRTLTNDTFDIFAISKNAKLLAVTIDNNSGVALYLNESSLNIASKTFTHPSTTHTTITYMTFFNNDEKLLILKGSVIIWNIFEDSVELYSINCEIMDLSGTIAYIDHNNDDIKLKLIKDFEKRNKNKSKRVLDLPEELKLSEERVENYGKNTEVNNHIFDDTEPWFCLNHRQTFYWLDYQKTTRISFGFYTIQIWKNSKLIYIWSDHYDYLPEPMPTQNINSLDISNEGGNIIVKFKCNNKDHEFQVNKLIDSFTYDHAIGACNTLNFFYKLNSSEISCKQLKINIFIEKTKNIIRNFIINKPDLWRLLDVRYNLMENLIHIQSNVIVKFILSSNQKLHIPQLYKWNGEKKLKHELLIALKNNDIVTIRQLSNYYSSNAMDNTGWMVTLTQALPEINKKFPDYIVELFKNPVFYEKQMYLAKSRIKSTLALKPSCNEFIVDTRLSLLSMEEFQNQSCKNSKQDNLNDNIKIYMTPLPDFNGFVKGRKQIIHSPFFKLMSQNNSNLVYKNNPTLEAIINFNWNIHSSQFNLRLIFYIIEFIIFNLHLLYLSFFLENRETLKALLLNISHALLHLLKAHPKVLDFYTFITLKAKPNYYQIFYIFSYISQLATLILFIFTYFYDLSTSSGFLTFISFTILIVWIELFLFLRFNSVVGGYILIISFLISAIIPYFLTLMIMIIGFSFSIFIMFSNVARLGIKPEGDRYDFVANGTKYLNVTMEQKIESPNLIETLEMTYLWLFGSWDNVKNWNYLPIKILAILASFFLIIIMTNIFVALMSDDISRARKYSEIASFKYKVDYILESYFYPLIILFERFYSPFENVEQRRGPAFIDIFYSKSTFHLLLDRYIFYIKSDKKKGTISKDTDESIEKLSEKHDNDIQKLDKKFDEIIRLLDQR